MLATPLAWKSASRGVEWRDEITLFESALDVCPNSLKVLNNLALKLLDKETAARAGELLDKALDLYPEYPSALFNRGLVHYVLKQHELAVEKFESSLKIEEHQPKTRAYLAQSLLTIAYELQRTGHWDEAEEVRRLTRGTKRRRLRQAQGVKRRSAANIAPSMRSSPLRLA